MNVPRINTHLFALYYLGKKITHHNLLVITDTDLIHRMHRVLRLEVGDTCILFDRTTWMEVTLTALARATITCTVIAQHDIKPWYPKIRFLLPVLKREALATAIYNLVEAGVQEIQLIQPQKVHRTFGGTKELERLERIAIAAAEQSKNFAVPDIKEPISWEEALILLQKTTSYVGDPTGIPIFDSLGERRKLPDLCTLLVGPEGDFTPREYAELKEAHVISLQLTPTILRAEMAAFYLAALFRSFFVQ